MPTSYSDNISWLAERSGQDWRDENVLCAVDWLSSLVPQREWERRADQVDSCLHAAKVEWAQGRRVALFDPADQIAWYMYLARCYGDPSLRPNFFEPEGYRVAPVFGRIGQLIPELRMISGAEERAARLMTEGRKQPDDGIYELLVAATYKKRGWTNVEFAAEMPGIARRPDLFVNRGRSHWAVECKRAGRSGYARDERRAGEQMAARVHEMSRAAKRPIVVMVRYTVELAALPESYLADKVSDFLSRDKSLQWSDEGGVGMVSDVFWADLLQVLERDYIWFGSSRMAELLLGRYDPSLDFSIIGDWTPAVGRPFHATWVDHLSLVAWTSMSMEAARRKAQHFRSVVGGASKQLPGDRPGVVHVGWWQLGGWPPPSTQSRADADFRCARKQIALGVRQLFHARAYRCSHGKRGNIGDNRLVSCRRHEDSTASSRPPAVHGRRWPTRRSFLPLALDDAVLAGRELATCNDIYKLTARLKPAGRMTVVAVKAFCG